MRIMLPKSPRETRQAWRLILGFSGPHTRATTQYLSYCPGQGPQSVPQCHTAAKLQCWGQGRLFRL